MEINLTANKKHVVCDAPLRHTATPAIAASGQPPGESLELLINGIAHDFNNLLSIIRASVNRCRSGKIPGGDIDEEMIVIAQATHQADNLLRQLQFYTGSAAMILRPLDFASLLNDIKPLLRVAVPRRISIKLKTADSLPPIKADRTQLIQVLANLVINAAEAIIDRPGQITIKTSLATNGEDITPMADTGVLTNGPSLRISISDTGIGIPATQIRQIFHPYFSTKGTGRGLGLSTVSAIVAAHGGVLQVESHPGRGSTFVILLPIIPDSPEHNFSTRRENPTTDSDTAIVPLCVLLVEDDPRVRQVTQLMLEALGCKVLSAANENETSRLLQDHHGQIDGVLLDANLSDMNGLRSLRAVRKLCPGRPVFLFSGHDEAMVRRSLAGQPFDGFIAKPFTRSDLAAMLVSFRQEKLTRHAPDLPDAPGSRCSGTD